MRQRPYFGFFFVCFASFICFAPTSCSAEPDVVQKYYRKVEPMLIEKRFFELDAMADDFRKSDARFPSGDQKLRHFTIV